MGFAVRCYYYCMYGVRWVIVSCPAAPSAPLRGAWGVSNRAEGEVLQVLIQAALLVGDEAGGTQVIRVVEIQELRAFGFQHDWIDGVRCGRDAIVRGGDLLGHVRGAAHIQYHALVLALLQFRAGDFYRGEGASRKAERFQEIRRLADASPLGVGLGSSPPIR